MRVLLLSVLFVPLVTAAARADDLSECMTRRAVLGQQAAAFKGDAKTKQFIDRALRRAGREQAEGDGDECIEALDHAAKLLANNN